MITLYRFKESPNTDPIGQHSDFLKKIIGNVKLDTFFLSFEEIEQNEIAALRYIGHEVRTSTSYYWDSLERLDTDTFVFQYTLSGTGVFETSQTTYELTPGKAFFASIPSTTRYFFPSGSEEWEYIFITLTGAETKKCWTYIQQTHGNVFDIFADAPMIQLLVSIHKELTKGRLNTAFQASGKAYEFLMACYSYFKEIDVEDDAHSQIDESIKAALIFIQTHFHEQLTLDDLAKSASLSKYYFIKKFKQFLGETPQAYLVKFRIKASQDLLLNTNRPVKEIAFEVGFTDSSYFYKVFRAITGVSVSMFRSQKVLKRLSDTTES